jgi:DNA-binding winged helix-turn-helix (wHTH) protein/predicted ATPase
MEGSVAFGKFRLDPANARLWHGPHVLHLKPKALAVLVHLVAHAGQLVTKEALFHAVWPGVAVSEGVLTTCVREVRHALRDHPQRPRFIETVHRRGYRFIAPFRPAKAGPPAGEAHLPAAPIRKPCSDRLLPLLVGRSAELAFLESRWEQARRGERQLVFITGEPGIGKTALVETFVAHLGIDGGGRIGRGQCIDHHGPGEAYLPVLQALGELGRGPDRAAVLAQLRRHAPSWLVQLPALLHTAARATLQRQMAGVTHERMLRELAEALEVLTAVEPFVLVLEDLHWSDFSTVELFALLARRRTPARLLVLGTYRPVDAIVREHPLKGIKQELLAQGQCAELVLPWLSEAAVAEYVAHRTAGANLDHGTRARVARLLHQRTDGNPLFMVTVAESVLTFVALRATATGPGLLDEALLMIPRNLQQLIEQRSAGLPPEDQAILAVASVVGVEFSAAAVAAAVETDTVRVEARCERLAQHGQFLQRRGTAKWPDGTVATCYGFLHGLYQEVLYARLPAAQRGQLHRRVGERLEAAYQLRAREIASELARHFAQGQAPLHAIHYYEQAARTALQHSAHHEAIAYLRRGLELLELVPDTPDRTRLEITLQLALGAPLQATTGYTGPEVEHAYARARQLCQQLQETPQLFPALWGLWAFYVVRAELRTASELGGQLLRLAQSTQDPVFLLEAHRAHGETLLWLGKAAPARASLERGLSLYDPQHHPAYAALYDLNDPRVLCLSRLALTCYLLGYPDQALKRMAEALAPVQAHAAAFSLAMVLDFTALIHHLRREEPAAQARAEAAIALSTAHGFVQWLAWGTFLRGRALTEQAGGAKSQTEEGLAQMCHSLAAWQATGAVLGRPHFLALLAEGYGTAGRPEEGLQVLAEALTTADNTGERHYEAELYRLKGELTRQKSHRGAPTFRATTARACAPTSQAEEEAEACFVRALEIARGQQAKAWELRAAMSLSRLWQQQGKKKQARQRLAEIYGWFTEGFDTKDLQEAKALLAELTEHGERSRS